MNILHDARWPVRMRYAPALLCLVVLSLPAGRLLAQHDNGRNAVRELAKGEIDKGIGTLQKKTQKTSSPVNEAERHFVLAMAESLRNQPEKALEHIEKAFASGLPPERILAGPRKTFAPLYERPRFQALMKSRHRELLHGPMVGAVTGSSARFWVRTASPQKVTVKVGGSTATAGTTVEKDYTTVLEIRDLKQETRYEYQVYLADGKVAAQGTFRTFPKRGEAASFTIGFGGGAGFTPEYEHMWKVVAEQKLSALLLLGDNVYIDDPEHDMTQHFCYYRRQSHPDWRSLVATTPIYAIYDDHDFGINDCVPGADKENPAWKRRVWTLFSQNWNNPSYGGGEENPGCWYDFHIGAVHFIMLDCRYYRDLRQGSMLGRFQKEWLFQKLESSPGTFKVLASSVPWSPGVKPGSRDTWDGFPDERAEIFSFIEKKKIGGVVLISADRHRTDLRSIPRPNGGRMMEFMSSRLTNVHTHPLMEKAKGSTFLFGYNKKCSFGMIDFEPKKAAPSVTFRVMSIDGDEVHSRKCTLQELSRE